MSHKILEGKGSHGIVVGQILTVTSSLEIQEKEARQDSSRGSHHLQDIFPRKSLGFTRENKVKCSLSPTSQDKRLETFPEI